MSSLNIKTIALIALQNFKNNSLLSHESEVNKLQDDGDRLIELKHPATSIVQVRKHKQYPYLTL